MHDLLAYQNLLKQQVVSRAAATFLCGMIFDRHDVMDELLVEKLAHLEELSN